MGDPPLGDPASPADRANRPPLDLAAVAPLCFGETELLGEGNYGLVADFTCCKRGQPENAYERDVSDWLKDRGRDGAAEAIRLGKVEVGLHLDADRRVIGFAAIGPDEWHIGDRPPLAVWLLHYLGVHTGFRTQPGVAREQRYGVRILSGALAEMVRRGGARFAALYVDPANGDAIGLYLEFGFHHVDVWTDPEGGRPWVRMMKKLV